jgi:dolichyl-diphosphooligosaccharide--protein glycosyltransferase
LAAVVALGIAGQTLAWEAGPLLVLPVGIVVAVSVLLAVRAPSLEDLCLRPLVAGVAGGALLALAAHLVLGWRTPRRHWRRLVAAGCLAILGFAVVV